MEKNARPLSRYFLLETPDFSGEAGESCTSYMRLGAVAEPERLRSVGEMQSCKPQLGATTMATGAGEDLAALLHPVAAASPATGTSPQGFVGFSDDKRQRSLSDAHDQLAENQRASHEVTLLDKERALQTAQSELASTQHILKQALADPRTWLKQLNEQERSTARRIRQLEVDLQKAAPAGTKNDSPSKANAHYCPDFTSKAMRRSESQKLHTKGGWRDHTDGNRIVTTRGDKLEVIRGNYRQVVLGHNPNQNNALGELVNPGWDVSGGHILEHGTTVAQATEIKWTQRHNGTWYATEETWKSDTKVKSTGDTESHAFGHMHVTVTGSDKAHVGSTPVQTHHEADACPGGKCHINPKVENTTFATESKTSTGSQRRPVPLMETHSWIAKSESSLNVATMSDTTKVSGSMTSHTDLSGGIQTDTVEVVSMKSSTTAQSMLTKNISALIASSSTGNSSSFTRGISTSLSIGPHAEVSLGASFSMSAAASASLTVGVSKEMFMGVKYELNVAPSLQLALGATITSGSAAKFNIALLTYCKVTPLQFFKALTAQL